MFLFCFYVVVSHVIYRYGADLTTEWDLVFTIMNKICLFVDPQDMNNLVKVLEETVFAMEGMIGALKLG